jgi:rare lipoprotein A
MVGPGTARVEIVALGERRQTASGDAFVPMDYYSGEFTFQVGAFSSRANAERLRARLDRPFTNAHVTPMIAAMPSSTGFAWADADDLESAEKYERTWPTAGIPMPLLWPNKKGVILGSAEFSLII